MLPLPPADSAKAGFSSGAALALSRSLHAKGGDGIYPHGAVTAALTTARGLLNIMTEFGILKTKYGAFRTYVSRLRKAQRSAAAAVTMPTDSSGSFGLLVSPPPACP
jgi:hypothetical protein